MAEVLITLGIIGIVAALTVPVLINYFTEQAYLTQFKKVYSELSQAYIQAAQDNGTADKWPSAVDAYTYLKPYLKIAQDCGSTASCVVPGGIKTLDGGFKHGGINYHVMLANGTTLLFYYAVDGGGGKAMTVNVNLNGNKPPNQFGYDYFIFELATKNDTPLVSWYSGAFNWASGHQYCDKNNPFDGTGWYRGGACAYWVLKHGNMDYLHRNISDTEWNN